MCVEAGSQTSDKADKQPASWNKSLGGFPFSLAGLAPGLGLLWVRVLGDRRPKGIGWYLAPKVR